MQDSCAIGTMAFVTLVTLVIDPYLLKRETRPKRERGRLLATRERDLTVKCQILLTFHLTVNLTLNGQMLNLTGSGETGNRPSFGSSRRGEGCYVVTTGLSQFNHRLRIKLLKAMTREFVWFICV